MSLIEPNGDGRALVHPSDTQSSDVRVISLTDVYNEFGETELTHLLSQDYFVTTTDVPQLGGDAVLMASEDYDLEVAWPIDTDNTPVSLATETGFIISGGTVLCPTDKFRTDAKTHVDTLD